MVLCNTLYFFAGQADKQAACSPASAYKKLQAGRKVYYVVYAVKQWQSLHCSSENVIDSALKNQKLLPQETIHVWFIPQ